MIVTENKRRNGDKWWRELGFRLVLFIIPACLGLSVWVMTQLNAAETNAKRYADRQDERIIKQIDENHDEVRDDLKRIEEQIHEQQRLLLEEIRNGR